MSVDELSWYRYIDGYWYNYTRGYVSGRNFEYGSGTGTCVKGTGQVAIMLYPQTSNSYYVYYRAEAESISQNRATHQKIMC